MVRAAVAIAAENDVDLLSAYTRLTSGHWWEIIVQPPAAITLLRMFPPDRVNSEDRPRSFANGQFLLFRRAAYDRLGGHSTVKDDLLEDLAFAKAVHRQGGRVRVVHSDTMIQTSMYESLDDLLGALERGGRLLARVGEQVAALHRVHLGDVDTPGVRRRADRPMRGAVSRADRERRASKRGRGGGRRTGRPRSRRWTRGWAGARPALRGRWPPASRRGRTRPA